MDKTSDEEWLKRNGFEKVKGLDWEKWDKAQDGTLARLYLEAGKWRCSFYLRLKIGHSQYVDMSFPIALGNSAQEAYENAIDSIRSQHFSQEEVEKVIDDFEAKSLEKKGSAEDWLIKRGFAEGYGDGLPVIHGWWQRKIGDAKVVLRNDIEDFWGGWLVIECDNDIKLEVGLNRDYDTPKKAIERVLHKLSMSDFFNLAIVAQGYHDVKRLIADDYKKENSKQEE